MSRKIVLAVALTLISISNIQQISAHEVLPKNLIEYIKQNPDATPSEIQQFVEKNNPELANKVENEEDILSITRNASRNWFGNFLTFIKLGIEHILTGPDHILFVISLLLVFTGFKQILKFTGAFTIAHSLTFILGSANLIHASASFIEPVIAFSIAYVAVTSVFFSHKEFFKSTSAKVSAVFIFGLFHGLGFAGLLQDIQVQEGRFLSSLLAFNVGIEFGQILVIACVLPFIYLFRKKTWYHFAIKCLAIAIATAGIYWGVERIIG